MSRSLHSRGSAHQGEAARTQAHELASELAPALALGAWATPLVEGRRVAIVGDTSSGIAEQIASAARRRVHAYDPDPSRAAASIARNRSASGEVSYAPLDEGLDTRRGAFDAVVVPDLAELDDDDETLSGVQSMLSARGVLVVASANTAHPLATGRTGLGYYELYDLLSERFDHLHMLGQAPFTGYTVADFASEGDPAITVDGSLMPGTEEPLWFIAVASMDALRIEPYTLLQLPLASCQSQLGLNAASTAVGLDTAALAEAQLKSSAVAAELDKLREREVELNRLAEERKHSATALSVQVTQLRTQLTESERELDRKRRELAKQSDLLSARTRETAKLREELTRAERELKRVVAQHEREREAAEEAFQEELDGMLERIAELEGAEEQETPTERAPEGKDVPDALAIRGYEFQIEELKKTLVQTRAELSSANTEAKQSAALQARVQELEQRGPAAAAPDAETEKRHATEIDALESRLRERAKSIETLSRQLREAERLGRELVRELERAKSEGTAPASSSSAVASDELAARQHALEQKCIRYEADLQAANWKIASLSEQLVDGSTPGADDHAALEEALRDARQQLAQLRAQGPSSTAGTDD